MIDLNQVSPSDLVQAGVAPDMAAQVALWRPYRSWSDLEDVLGAEMEVVERLRDAGFTIVPPDESTWAKPAPFRLSASA